MTVDGSRLAGNMLPLSPRDPDAEQRARLAVAWYARRELTAIRYEACRELLDMLGLLPEPPEEA